MRLTNFRMRFGIGPIILLLFVASAYAESGRFDVRVKSDRVDIDVLNAPIHAVFGQIALQAGIEILVQPGMQGRITANFKNVSLEDALKQLLTNYSHSMVFTKLSSGPRKGEIVLSQLKIHERGSNPTGKFETLGIASADPSIRTSSLDTDALSGGAGAESKNVPAERSSAPPRENPAVSNGSMSPALSNMQQSHYAEAARLRREIAEERSALASAEDPREQAKARSQIARKTMQLEEKQKWMDTRIRGFQRLERQIPGVQP